MVADAFRALTGLGPCMDRSMSTPSTAKAGRVSARRMGCSGSIPTTSICWTTSPLSKRLSEGLRHGELAVGAVLQVHLNGVGCDRHHRALRQVGLA